MEAYNFPQDQYQVDLFLPNSMVKEKGESCSLKTRLIVLDSFLIEASKIEAFIIGVKGKIAY